MATWVTHLMIADEILKIFPILKRQEFCVGSIAPDCNVENADFTEFTPPRSVTHFMSGKRKSISDAERFYDEYINNKEFDSSNEHSFLLGYYAHLLTDAEFQKYIRDEKRVADSFVRIRSVPEIYEKANKLPQNFDTIKSLIPKSERMKDIHTIEAEYLEKNPNSGYFTEIIPLRYFPDHIDILPKGAIVRKIGVMGYIPKKEKSEYPFVCISLEEYKSFIDSSVSLISQKLSPIL